MCDKCKQKSKRFVHIVDSWTQEERIELFNYLQEKYMEGSGT